ncbi:MAG: hypothetical protein FGM52_04295 [Mycobacterium sp.]|nr:hypothetical protein [Mycobacterium sp.]
MSRAVDPQAVREAVMAVGDWLRDGATEAPARALVAAAVRLTARAVAAAAPGASVEVRVPPFVAVQCISGPRHTRGAPPNVVETEARTWLLLAAGLVGLDEAAASGRLSLSGSRAGAVASLLPLVRLPG